LRHDWKRWRGLAALIDPYFEPSWYWRLLGLAHFIAHQYQDAMAALGKVPNPSYRALVLQAACLAQLGRLGEAQVCAREAARLAPDFSIGAYMARQPFRRDADRQHLIEGMRKAGLPE
jgi:hypothetical protein